MKKFIYSLLIFGSLLALSSACTDEQVAPSTELMNGGGGARADKNM